MLFTWAADDTRRNAVNLHSLLGVLAAISAMLVLFDPNWPMKKWSSTLPGALLEDPSFHIVKAYQMCVAPGRFFYLIFCFLLEVLYTLIVEPLAVGIALIRGWGNQPLAWLMVPFVIYSFWWMVISHPLAGDRVLPKWLEMPLLGRRLAFYLPTLYLIYLFFVAPI